jgi:uncharacterized protein DUF6578
LTTRVGCAGLAIVGASARGRGFGVTAHNGRVDMTVWVDDWQLQCCGDPFAVGSTVSWTLRGDDFAWLDTMLGTDHLAARVSGAEDHHADVVAGARAVSGTVVAIEAVHSRYAPATGGDQRHLFPVAGSGTVRKVTTAYGWTPAQGDRKFVGYLVRLRLPARGAASEDDVSRAASEDDVE